MNDRKEEHIRKDLLKVTKLVGRMWSITSIRKASGSVSQIDEDNYQHHKTNSVKTLQEIIRLIENDEI